MKNLGAFDLIFKFWYFSLSLFLIFFNRYIATSLGGSTSKKCCMIGKTYYPVSLLANSLKTGSVL